MEPENNQKQTVNQPTTKRSPSLSILLLILLAAIVIVGYNCSAFRKKLSVVSTTKTTTSPATETTTTTTTAGSADIDAEISTADKSLDAINDDQDFGTSALSDTQLGL